MKGGGIVVACALALSGCGLAQHAALTEAREKADADASAAIAKCTAAFPSRVRGKAADEMRCKAEAYKAHSEAVAAEYADLARLGAARAIEAGERYDAGKISGAQLDLELATIESETESAVRVRSAQSSMVSSAQSQAAAAQSQAAMQRAQSIQDAFSMPKTTDCTTYGNRTSCQTR